MPRYIDAFKLIEYANNMRDKNIDANDIARFPAADVAPVVRCKDCKYYSGASDKDGYVTAIGFCNHESHHIMPLRYDFYCADAKKI